MSSSTKEFEVVELLYIRVGGRRGSSSTERRGVGSPCTGWWDDMEMGGKGIGGGDPLQSREEGGELLYREGVGSPSNTKYRIVLCP